MRLNGPESRRPAYAPIHNWRYEEGNGYNQKDDEASAAVCVLGEKAKVSIFGYGPALGKFVKVNDTWLQVGGKVAEVPGVW